MNVLFCAFLYFSKLAKFSCMFCAIHTLQIDVVHSRATLSLLNNNIQWWIQDFPAGGASTSLGGADSRGGYISKILYVKRKESGPLGGMRRARPLDLPVI